jgi:tetratricopeptide repeat protein 8
MDPLWLAMSKYRRGKLEDCIGICDELLSRNPRDEAAWLMKCKSVIKQNYIDDIELDEEGVAEMLLDENAVAAMPRYRKPQTDAWLCGPFSALAFGLFFPNDLP